MRNDTTLCFCTLAVADLEVAEAFYVQVLGLCVSRRYPATVWLSLDVDEHRGAGFGLIEDAQMARPSTKTMIDLQVGDLGEVFERLATLVEVVEPPVLTGWGSYKAIIEDPFGNRLGLVARN
ncbi:VOC family protein [Pseudomonas sp. CCOS 191]|uniref:VOC family protein n=1 Tax=Pseudomonas sp. CCOS 191 TaxID=1649877 RepID=UPI000624A220|nr:VOC family protein [Pseudomonas sp. CCOS 191]CRI58572.1 hypothetical protein CCOS191_4036 [Pseudomonas sp. CCOS 191]